MEIGSIARLTDREKDCLRRWLRHQTAKEMALELGISPHAVEKRLKSARAKLGVTTSLEAARQLAACEGYQRTASQPPDLPAADVSRKDRFTKTTLAGATFMTILFASALALAVSQAGGFADKPADTPAPESARLDRGALPPGRVAPSDAEVILMTQTTFHHVDADNSGYIDGAESPLDPSPGPQPVYRRDENGNAVPTGERVMQNVEEIQAEFYRTADTNGDGRISYPEFHRWSAPNIVRNGIPAEWQEDMSRWMSTEG